MSCNYFILLIGYRRGHWYKENEISVTHFEYRAAKNLIENGNPLKIVTFVRKSIWLLKADREGLMKHFTLKAGEYSQEIKETGSTVIDDPEYIFNLINEVSAGINYPNTNNPTNNWIYDFNNFSDIISALKHAFKIKDSLEEKRIKSLLIRELESNYNRFKIPDYDLDKPTKSGDIKTKYFFDYFKDKYKSRIMDKDKKPLFIDNPFRVTDEEFGFLWLYSCIIPIQIGFRDIKTSILDKVIDEGIFLNFNLDKADFDVSLLSLSLEKLSNWLGYFKNVFTTDIYQKFTEEMNKIAYSGQARQPLINLSVTAAGIITIFINDYRIPYLISAVLDVLKNNDFKKLIEIDFS